MPQWATKEAYTFVITDPIQRPSKITQGYLTTHHFHQHCLKTKERPDPTADITAVSIGCAATQHKEKEVIGLGALSMTTFQSLKGTSANATDTIRPLVVQNQTGNMDTLCLEQFQRCSRILFDGAQQEC